ncbi:hypothetical protein [Streptomyces sp. NPDC047000]|uniref:hypothetical protein n=1 Tax=Streptomyces sp. NPDC047000 TaxID=3155474 RepID=UPI0033E5DB7F
MGTKTTDEATTETGTGATGAATEEKAAARTAEAEAAQETETAAEQAATGTPAEAGTETAGTAAAEDDESDESDASDESDDDLLDDLLDGGELPAAEPPAGVGQGAAAVVSAVLGLVSLTGGWIGSVAAARETLVGQLQTSSSASVAKQIKEIYGDAWHTTALWAGLFALTALITGVAVLARPAFGTPGRTQAPWIRSVAWAGVVLGVVGLLLAVLKYTDALLALPSTSS